MLVIDVQVTKHSETNNIKNKHICNGKKIYKCSREKKHGGKMWTCRENGKKRRQTCQFRLIAYSLGTS